MKKTLLILFIAVCVAEVCSILIDNELLHLIAKPLIMVSLIAYYLLSATGERRSNALLVAMIFSWLGDVLLMVQGNNGIFFIPGLLAFLAAHLFFIFAYRNHQWEETDQALYGIQKIRLSFPIILAGSGLVVILYPSLQELRFPVMVYALVLVLMVLNALFRYGRTSSRSFWLVLCGALLFMISDSVLAINKFMQPLPDADLWIMITYCSAQFLIVKGLLHHFNRH